MMEHQAKGGGFKIKNRCELPLTGTRCVHRIITDLAVLDVVADGLKLVERAAGVSVADIQKATEPELIVSGDVPEIGAA